MSQITGLRVGTPFADALIASLELTGYQSDLAEWAKSAIFNASIYTDSGDDRITAIGTSNNQGGFSGSYQIYGVYQGLINSGAGNDIITITSHAYNSPGPSAVGIYNTLLDGGSGDDAIQITITAEGYYGASTYGQIGGSIRGGSGQDVISISARGRGDYSGLNYGVHQGSIFGDSGNDQINISALGGPSLNQGLVDGGEGDDRITISSEGLAGRHSPIYGTAALEANIYGGNGNDVIAITATTSWLYSDTSLFGVVQSNVYGGNGQDEIVIEGQTLGIRDSLIDGGNGQDRFNIGRGSGTIDGGNSRDLIMLTFFDPQTMQIEALANNGLRITGTIVHNSWYTLDWTQTIINMEQFQIGSNLFTSNRDVVAYFQSMA